MLAPAKAVTAAHPISNGPMNSTVSVRYAHIMGPENRKEHWLSKRKLPTGDEF